MIRIVNVNDKVFSDRHGLGHIISAGTIIEIEFIDGVIEKWYYTKFPYEVIDSKFSCDDDMDDVKVLDDFNNLKVRDCIDDDCELEKSDKLANKGRNSKKVNIQYVLESIKEELNTFDLTGLSRKLILDFFTFKLKNKGRKHRSVRLNLLIQGENESENERLIDFILNQLYERGIDNRESKKITESKAFCVDDEEDEFFKNIGDAGIIAIHKCEGIDKDTVRIVSSVIRAEIQREKRRKDKNWSVIKKLSAIDKDVIFIVAGDSKFVEYLKTDDELYYRVFSHHITFKKVNEEDIINKFYLRLKEENLKTTTGFDYNIIRYIKVVYPKADLKDRDFVDDLLNRVLVNYYIVSDGNIVTEECVPYYRKPKPVEEIMRQLDKLVGLKSVKEAFRKLYKLSLEENTKLNQRLNFAFIGNPGTGKTTVGNLTAELLSSMGLLPKNKLVVVTPTDVISVYRGESAQLMQEKIEEAMGGVLFIDEAYFLTSNTSDVNSPEKKCLEVLLQAMEQHRGKFAVVFAGYEEEINNLIKSNAGLASRIPYKFVFEDYTDEELMEIFTALMADEDFKVANNAKTLLKERIALARTEDNFGNARTVSNIYQQLKSIWSERESGQKIFIADDIRSTMPMALNTDLQDMIGLESVKEKLKLFESRVKYLKFMEEKQLKIPQANMHMMFTGNPGTGKTTVAKKIADCLYHIGVLKTNKLVVVERRDLVAEHIGGTATKTNACVQKAMNGVLFIDEAYSLYRENDPKDYGREVIETLITAMEEYKGKFIVIMAGYKKEMNDFFNANPGIFSRIGFTFHFDDYTPDELSQIFLKKMSSAGFKVDKLVEGKIKKVMKYFSAMENFGNGRFVDKLIDLTISNRSLRAYSRRYNDISEEDIPEIAELAKTTASVYKLVTDEERSHQFVKRIAVHEAGHAIVLKALCPEQKIDTLTINGDAMSLGKLKISYDLENITETFLQAVLAVKFGGRNAERIIFGEHSSGCIDDMYEARTLADKMINEYVMGELGVTTAIDLLKKADDTATEVLLANKKQLEFISDFLVKEGAVSGDKFDCIVSNV